MPSDHPEIPDIGPTEGEPMNPVEWIDATGPVKWKRSAPKTKCGDCLHLILDHLNGVQAFARPPGLARPAKYTRTQAEVDTHHCSEHYHWRNE